MLCHISAVLLHPFQSACSQGVFLIHSALTSANVPFTNKLCSVLPVRQYFISPTLGFCTFLKKIVRDVLWMRLAGLTVDDGWIVFNRRKSSSFSGQTGTHESRKRGFRKKWSVLVGNGFFLNKSTKFVLFMKECGFKTWQNDQQNVLLLTSLFYFVVVQMTCYKVFSD